MINYKISLSPNSHVYHVELSFIATTSNHQLKLPTWIPGSYMIREFSKNIIALNSTDSSCRVTQINKNSWELSGLIPNQLVVIKYAVYAYDFGIRTAYLDHERGYFNPTSLCLYVVGYEENTAHTITLAQLPEPWSIATALEAHTKIANTYIAKNYAELIDCPFELGNLRILNFVVKDTPHKIALSGIISSNFNEDQLIQDVIKICTTQIDLFGGVAPFTEYTFLLHLGGKIFTGLEHSNSTALLAPYYSLPCMPAGYFTTRNENYIKLLTLISHEYFHVWNVKRIKPAAFTPYNLDAENYTKLLWWFEGITSYYEALILYRCGLLSQEQYLKVVITDINDVYKYHGSSIQPLTNASLTAWIKYYRQDENSPNVLANYYIKGAVVGMCLDILIRHHTNGAHSLDNVLLGLYRKWLDDKLGIGDDELMILINTYANCNLTNYIVKFTETTAELPLNEVLALVGLSLSTKSDGAYLECGNYAQPQTDKSIAANKNDTKCKLHLGCKLAKDGLGYRITNVYSGGVADKAGMAAHDIIIAINDIQLTDIDNQLSLYKSGDTLLVTLFRRERLCRISVKLEQLGCKISNLQLINQDQLAKWL